MKVFSKTCCCTGAVGYQKFVQYIRRYVMPRTVYFGWICTSKSWKIYIFFFQVKHAFKHGKHFQMYWMCFYPCFISFMGSFFNTKYTKKAIFFGHLWTRILQQSEHNKILGFNIPKTRHYEFSGHNIHIPRHFFKDFPGYQPPCGE